MTHLQLHLKKYHPDEADVSSEQFHEMVKSLCHLQNHSMENYDSLTMVTFLQNSLVDNQMTDDGLKEAMKKTMLTASFQRESSTNFFMAQRLNDRHILLFFAISQLVFNCSHQCYNYLSMILSLLVPVWVRQYFLILKIPLAAEQFLQMITSNRNSNSFRNVLPHPFFLDMGSHTVASIVPLLGYTVMAVKGTLVKDRHRRNMKSHRSEEFIGLVRKLAHAYINTVVVRMVLWMDGFDPNTSTKQNGKGAWVCTVTFFCYDLTKELLYLVETMLLASGPGKGGSNEDHTLVFEKIRDDLSKLTVENGDPKPF